MKLLTALKAAALLSLAGATAGCFVSVAAPPTAAQVEERTNRVFAAPPPEVFKATAVALRSQGYELVLVDEEKGRITTGQKTVRASHAPDGASSALVTRRYDVRIVAQNGKTRVTAMPREFVGDEDVSGADGDAAGAERLFADIDANLR